jgi:hypothetical protein
MSNPPASPGFIAGQVLTAAELNSALVAKQDYPAITQPPGTSDTTIATTAFVSGAVSGGAQPSNTAPLAGGTAAPGTSALYSRGDHVHPAASPPPPPSTTLPLMDGVGATGTTTVYARSDHIHPSDTSRAPLASPAFTGTPTAPTPTTGDNSQNIATTAFVQNSVGSGGGSAQPAFISITDHGGVGDGTTDNLSAWNAAIAALGSSGGTIYIPPGTWYNSYGWDTPSNTNVQGAGPQTILIGNPSTVVPNNYTMIVYATMSGTGNKGLTNPALYAINSTTIGTNTVTTTTPADAGNFAAGDIIFISGPKHGTGFWYPCWHTAVTASNASTGVITLAENLILGGTAYTLVQKVVIYPQNIRVSDLTFSIPAGAITGGFQANIARNVVLERIGSTTMSAIRHPYISMSAVRSGAVLNSRINGYLDFDGSVDSIMAGNTIVNGTIAWEGGVQNSSAINNSIENPVMSMPPVAACGIAVSSDSQFNRIIGNAITGVFNNQSGILLGQNNDAGQGNNVVANNTIVGADTTIKGIALTSTQNNVLANNIINTASIGLNILTNSTGQVVVGNQFIGVTNNIGLDATSSIVAAPLTNEQWFTLPAGTTSPNVTNNALIMTANTSATTITGFTGGVSGQVVTLYINDANTTLQPGGFFNLMQYVNYTPPAATFMRFVNRNNIWFETSRLQTSTAAFAFPRGLTVGPNVGLTISGPSFATAAPQNITATSATISSTSATLAPTGACTLTLPAATAGTWLHLVLTTAQAVTSASANVIPLAGGSAGTAILSGTSPPHWCILQANGTNWVTFAAA